MGQTTGQLIGSILSNKDEKNKEERERANIAALVSMGIGLTDASLTNTADRTIEKLNKSKVTDIAKSSKQYDDAVKLQTVQDSIDQSGGGLNGAKVHFGINAETAFNAKHENVLHLFEGPGLTQANRDMKSKWKNDYIENNLYKRHEAKYKGIDAANITQLSKEEFNADTNNYYDAKTRQANDPANRSIIHKGINRGAEFLGFNTKRDRLYEDVLEAEIKFNKRNETIDKYRNVYASPKIFVPTKLTKNTIEGLDMTKNEFFEAWNNDSNLSQDYAEYAFQKFQNQGGRLIDYQNVAVGYLGNKAYNDTIPLKDKAIAKARANPLWEKMKPAEQVMSENIAVVEAMGGNANSLKLHLETRRAVNELIDTGKYKLPTDDEATEKDERKEAEDLIYANTWAKVKKETVRKLTGEIDLDKVRQDYVTSASTLLYSDIRNLKPETINAIETTQLPSGTTAASKQFGEIYLQNTIQNRYKNNQPLLKRLQTNLSEYGYNLQTLQTKDREAASVLREAQQRYFIYKQHEDFNAGSFIATRQLELSQDPLNFSK